MKKVPTTWEEVKFIDGYPGKYVILARKSGGRWYVVGINAEKETLKKTITLPMFAAGSTLQLYSDDAQLNGSVKTIKQKVPTDDLKYKNITTRNYYLPLPEEQIVLNPNLKQNWGYAGETSGDPYTALGWD